MFFFFAGAAGATILIWMKWETFEDLIKTIFKALRFLIKYIFKSIWFLIKLPFLLLLSPILIPRKIVKYRKARFEESRKKQAMIAEEIFKHRGAIK